MLGCHREVRSAVAIQAATAPVWIAALGFAQLAMTTQCKLVVLLRGQGDYFAGC